MSWRDGAPKYLTRECAGCPFYAAGAEAVDRLLMAVGLQQALTAARWRRFCLWGPTLKTLVGDRASRGCGIRNRRAPGAVKWMAMMATGERPPEVGPLFQTRR